MTVGPRYRPVLVVEDSDEDFEAIRRAFDSVDPEIPLKRAADGDAAVESLFAGQEASEPPGLVLLDLHLPGVDGQEILALIRRDAGLAQVPVIILTTSEDDADVTQTYAEGASAYVLKSHDPREFARRIVAMKTFWYSAVQLPRASSYD